MPKVTRKTIPSTEEESKPIGSVYVERGFTKNMGDFNSAKMSVGITLPLNPTKEDIASAVKTIKIAEDIIEAELDAELKTLG